MKSAHPATGVETSGAVHVTVSHDLADLNITGLLLVSDQQFMNSPGCVADQMRLLAGGVTLNFPVFPETFATLQHSS